MEFNKKDYIEYLTKLAEYFSQEFEGIKKGRTSSRTLIRLKNKLEREIRLVKPKTYTQSEILNEKMEILEQVYNNLDEATTDWHNPLSIYDDDEQSKIDKEVTELDTFLNNFIEEVRLYTDDLIKHYLERDEEFKKDFQNKGTLLFYTSNDVKELATNLQNHDIELAQKIDTNLQDFYESILLQDKYFITVGNYDIELFKQAIKEVKGIKVKEEFISKVLFYLDNQDIINIKRKYIHNEELLKEHIIEQVKEVIRILDTPIKRFTMEELPNLINTLDMDIKYHSNDEISIKFTELLNELNKFPNDIIHNLEREIEFNMLDTNMVIYKTILGELLFKLGIQTTITSEDIYEAIGEVDYLYHKLPILEDLLNLGQYVTYKDTIFNKENYLNKIREFYEDNELIINEEIKDIIYSKQESHLDKYMEILSNIKPMKRDSMNMGTMLKSIEELKMKYKSIGIDLKYSEYNDGTNRISIKCTTPTNEYSFDVHNRFIMNIDTGTIIFTNIKDLEQLQRDTLLSNLDDSDTYNEVSLDLLDIVINKR